ncbi:site-specific integrase [Halobacteriovorax marinus]|uniref:hypothetical protein n=1 Tax=Halobacteriovorax marinus TaxID=97084 RepID=UPI000313EEBD|nr:hypothetical protein [Halobacteriovorax marinus]
MQTKEKITHKSTQAISQEKIQAFLSTLKEEGSHLFPLFSTQYYLGLRTRETLGLREDSFLPETNEFDVFRELDTRTCPNGSIIDSCEEASSPRKILIPPQILPFFIHRTLFSFFAVIGDKRLLLIRQMRQKFKEHFPQANLATLRTSRIIHLYQDGVDKKELMRTMGFKSSQTIDRYINQAHTQV